MTALDLLNLVCLMALVIGGMLLAIALTALWLTREERKL